MPWPDLTLYLGLFLNALIAATLLPALSEVALASLIATGKGQPIVLVLAATSGNVLGSVINWWLGLACLKYQHRRWFPFSHTQLKRGSRLFDRFGYPALLFAWLPVVGDPLTFAAGVLRMRFVPFVLFVTTGKLVRYILIALAANAF
ncbi:YqaA family protein [Kordiimonas aestuarii]|uniref:YqaA family protein n=1 Tax=Kordiimonas aestuarii TaxID=1005925 RepID=UPI0021D2860D|nr:YqaA family protein [Kordiimonas aestuarii]